MNVSREINSGNIGANGNNGERQQVIQRRGDFKNPVDYFYKNWTDYQMGFGKLTEDFWLGNDKIYALTNQGNYSLRIDMQDLEGEKRYALYREFWIESERQAYQLHVGGYTGNAVLILVNLPRSTHPGPVDCAQILKGGSTESGIYRIWPLNWQTIGSFEVYCDMETDSGGWTVIQRRGDFKNPVDYFFKTWKEYQMGFGRLNQEFWLGNDKIYAVTNQGNYTLRIDMQDKEGEKRYAFYQEFRIESEKQGYQLHVNDYTGDAGDSFSFAKGMKFTTKDQDNDLWGKNCAETFKGGWWYTKCHGSNLNGLYHNGYHKSYADGIDWSTWKGHNYSLPIVDMKIRPTN